jgi:hypothetical protein
MQFKNDFAAIWCVKQCHPNQDTFLHLLHVKITDTLKFCKAGLFTTTVVTMLEETPWLLTLKMDIHRSLSLLAQMKRPMNPKLSASQKLKR